MAEVKPDHVYKKNLLVLEKIMGLMFNNVNFSDTMFTVNEQKFYALSQLLAASSATLDTLISTHYKHCQDKDIKLYGIRNEESFMIILQYIYGMNINFSQMNITVMCEVLALSEKYKLDDFFKDLKCFLSEMMCFQLDSVVALLNTSSKYNISELYKRVTVFAYDNTEELVNHETFLDLQYNVLVDLIKSDWFYCSEIDILTGMLAWHSDMYDESKISKKTIENDNIVIGEDDDANSDKMVTKEEIEIADLKEETMNSEHSDLNGKYENPNADDLNEIQSTILDKRAKCKETVQSFCENVLKSLLCHIRLSEISAKVWVASYKTEWFKKYSDYLGNEDYFSLSSTPRQKYVAVTSVEQEVGNGANDASYDVSLLSNPQYEEISNITKTFTIQCGNHFKDSWLEVSSYEDYFLAGMKWKMQMNIIYDEIDSIDYQMFLKCITSDNQSNWIRTVECQLKRISLKCVDGHRDFTTKVFDEVYLVFTRDNDCHEIALTYIDEDDTSDSLRSGCIFEFELNFISIT
ncbi:hypothetical protein WDU94_013824 [Cyamophila willieti]